MRDFLDMQAMCEAAAPLHALHVVRCEYYTLLLCDHTLGQYLLSRSTCPELQVHCMSVGESIIIAEQH